MSDHTELYQETIRKVTENMHTNNEWASRYAGYISAINNIGAEIKQADSKFGFAKNLDIYLPVSKAKQANSRTVYFDVRYKGQSVAELRVNNKQEVTICFKTDTNMRDYLGYPSDLQDISNKELVDWHGQKARAFRKFFAGSPERKNGNNLEHNFESQLLNQFSLKSSSGKIMCNIQPVILLGKWFQMPTPFNACRAKDNAVKFSFQYGGGIDILARQGHGKGTYLTVIELKDECKASEPPERAIAQAIAYATFLRFLLRTPDADPNGWWKFFGFGGTIPEKLKIKAVIAMPVGKYNDTLFANEALGFPDSNDCLEMHYIFFNVNKNKIEGIAQTSL